MDIPKPPNGLDSPETANVANATTPEPPLPVWMQRACLVIYVLFCLEVGLLLALVPWTQVWTRNTYSLPFDWLRTLAQSGFARGTVTGVGLIDIWLGIWEAVQYRDERRTPAPAVPQDPNRTTVN